MATSFDTTPSPAMQPDLLAFIVYDQVPAGCAAYPVTDNRQAPLLRAGDWVIADTLDRQPTEGELFVIRWQSGDGRPKVVEAAPMKNKDDFWAVGARHRGANAKAIGWGEPGKLIGDAPYRAEQLTERFLGRVIGLFQPVYAEPALAA